MKRNRQTTRSGTNEIAPPDTDADLGNWLEAQAKEHNLCWLLAHADDGVIWGVWRESECLLALAHTAFPHHSPPLRWPTLQHCRLFGPAGELLLWPGDQGWHAILRRDDMSEGSEQDYLEEEHLLWGDNAVECKEGFCLVREGARTILHALPLSTTPTKHQRARLRVRHYLATDAETGMVRIAASRLVDLIAPETTKGDNP